MYIRFVALVFLCITGVQPLRAQSAYELIETHRQWMADSYPNAETLSDEQLLKEAALAIHDMLMEPEAKELLLCASRKVPVLTEYVAFLDSGKPDYHLKATIAALTAISEASEREFGKYNETTAWCRFVLLENLAIMQDVVELAKDMTQDQEEAVRLNPTKENRAMLCIMKLAIYNYLYLRDFTDSPEYYDEILQTGKTVLELFPLDDETVSLTRAYLYNTTADAIGAMSFELEANTARERSGFNDTPYFFLQNGIQSNAGAYYSKAVEVFGKLYSPAHPVTMTTKHSYDVFLHCQVLATDEGVEKHKTFATYTEQYFPKGSLESLMARCDLWLSKIYVQESVVEAISRQQLLDDLKLLLGEDNHFFLDRLGSIAIISAYQYPQSSDAIFDYFDSMVECLNDKPIAKAYNISCIYNMLKDSQPERTIKKMNEVYDLYRQYHNAEPLSIRLGRELVYNCYTLSNYRTAAEMQGFVCQDTEAMYGETSHIYLAEEKNRIDFISQFDKESPATLFPELIRKMEANGADYNEALDSYADYALYVMGDGELSERLYRKLIDNISAEYAPSEQAYSRLKLISAIGKARGYDSECELLYQKALELMDQETDTLNIIFDNYNLASSYLCDTERYAEALDILDKGLGYFDVSIHTLDDRYLTFLKLKIDILYYMGNMVEAQRLMAQQFNGIDLDNPLNQTPILLDYLWNCYNFIKVSSNCDFSQLNAYIADIAQLTFSLYQQSGQNEQFYNKYVVSFLTEQMNLCVRMNINLGNDDISELPQDFRDVLDNIVENRGELYNALKQLEEEYEQRGNSEDKDNYANVLYSLAEYHYVVDNDMQKAEEYLQRYCELKQNDKPLEVLSAQMDLANFLIGQKRYTEAEKALEMADEALLSMANPSLNNKISVVSGQCALYRLQGKMEKGIEKARQCYTLLREIFDGNFKLMTEREQNSMMDTYNDPAGWYTSFLEAAPETLAAETYNAVLFRTGLQLRSHQATRNAIRESGNTQLMALIDSVSNLRTQRSAIAAGIKDTEKTKEQASITIRLNSMEQRIIEESEPYRRQNQHDPSWEQVRDKLQKDEAAIEFVYSYNHIMALILRSGCMKPIAVQLTSMDSLSAMLKALEANSSAQMAKRLYSDQSTTLYSMLWQPMEEHLQDVKTIYMSQPGILGYLSFEAFALSDGYYLMDKYDLHHLTTTAELLKETKETKPKSIMLMADIYYSDSQQLLAVSGGGTRGDEDEEDVALEDFERGASSDHFKYLKHTAEELEAISNELQKHETLKGGITVKEKKDATESAFRQLVSAKSPDVIHLATHGFLVSDFAKAVKIPFYAKNPQNVNFMNCSGVALADAETTWRGAEKDEKDDGILTAEEVSRMNLRNTQLVTLSACETALGNYTFEGVFGLSRGFKQAGAQSLLVSLWSVNDLSTSKLMSTFYKLWLNGATKHDALHNAMQEVRAEYTEPYYWAPFILLD